MKPHPVQRRLWHSPARFKIVPAGRRSGKTEWAKRRLVMALWDCYVGREPRVNGRYFAAAPTEGQAKNIWWEDLVALTPKSWIRSILLGEMRIVTKWGASIKVVGLDKPQRMEGVPWAGGVIDEYADCGRGSTVGLWQANIRPALSTLGAEGWCWLIGVPDRMSPGQVEYEKMVEYAKKGTDPEWACFTWPSSDILDPKEVASARATMDPRTFAQEYLGEFVLSAGRAFPDFDTNLEGLHVSESVTYDPALPLCLSCDFNVNPMCWGVIQHYRGEVRIINEFTLEDTRTIPACRAFISRANGNGWNLNRLSIYGDASGKARDSTSSESDWQQILNEFRFVEDLRYCVPASNPSIKDTVNAVNAKILSADDVVTLRVNPDCVTIIDNLRSALWPSPKDLSEEHALAWLRYFVNYEYPIESNEPAVQGSVLFAGGPYARR